VIWADESANEPPTIQESATVCQGKAPALPFPAPPFRPEQAPGAAGAAPGM